MERIFFPCVRFPRLEEWDLEKSSIYDLLTTAYDIKLGRISQTVEAVADTIAHQLRVEENFPLLLLTRILFKAETEEPIVFSQDFLRSDYAKIHTDLEVEDIGLMGENSRSGKETID